MIGGFICLIDGDYEQAHQGIREGDSQSPPLIPLSDVLRELARPFEKDLVYLNYL